MKVLIGQIQAEQKAQDGGGEAADQYTIKNIVHQAINVPGRNKGQKVQIIIGIDKFRQYIGTTAVFDGGQIVPGICQGKGKLLMNPLFLVEMKLIRVCIGKQHTAFGVCDKDRLIGIVFQGGQKLG